MSSVSGISRRDFVAGTVKVTAAAAGAATIWPLWAGEPPGVTIEEGVWDAHCHLSGVTGSLAERLASLLLFADRMGVERLIIFMGFPWSRDPSPDEMRRQNDQVLCAVDRSGGRVLSFVYLNPKHVKESLEELDRCVAGGPMVGVKLWVALRCSDSRLDPIVERATELKAPMLQHTWGKITGNLPGESTAMDLATLARRHPKASFIAAHVNGDWEAGIRAIRAADNILADICGSDPTAGMVEMAVRELGAQRVIYGSDGGARSYASQLAKVYGADIPVEAKKRILRGNIRRLLRPILSAKGMGL